MKFSWKTTGLGILGLISIVSKTASELIQGIPVDWTIVATTVMTSVGLLFAKDYNVSGGTKP
jgi:hypothetical protein